MDRERIEKEIKSLENKYGFEAQGHRGIFNFSLKNMTEEDLQHHLWCVEEDLKAKRHDWIEKF